MNPNVHHSAGIQEWPLVSRLNQGYTLITSFTTTHAISTFIYIYASDVVCFLEVSELNLACMFIFSVLYVLHNAVCKVRQSSSKAPIQEDSEALHSLNFDTRWTWVSSFQLHPIYCSTYWIRCWLGPRESLNLVSHAANGTSRPGSWLPGIPQLVTVLHSIVLTEC
jgi:hypothetical protein